MHRHIRHLLLPQHTNNHRPRLLHPEGIAVLSAIVLAVQLLTHVLASPPGRLPAVLGFSSSITASQVVEQTNTQRSAAGLTTLRANDVLSRAAQAKGAHMCKEQYWAHISPSGTTPWLFIRNAGYKYSVAGENLARDFADTQSMVAAWMASPTHKANIVNPRYADIGVAVIDCKLLGSDTALVVQMFGSQVSARSGTATRGTLSPRAQTNVQGIETQEQVFGEFADPDAVAQIPPVAVDVPTAQTQTPVAELAPDEAPSMSWFTPLQVRKAFFLSILGILLCALIVDLWLAQHRKTVRLVGRNLAHIVFLAGITVVVLAVHAGVVL